MLGKQFPRNIFLISCVSLLAACGGGGGGGPAPVPQVTVTNCTGSGNVTISGRIRFEKPGFRTSSGGLNLDAPQLRPARRVLVEIVCAGNNSILRAIDTDDQGTYSLRVSSGGAMFLRVRARMLLGGSPSWNARVVDNTSNGALWAARGNEFTPAGNQTRNLTIPTGWGGSSYTSNRAAAPFAILDAIYESMLRVLGVDGSAQFPTLVVNWSPDNVPSDTFNPSNGDIVTTFYSAGNIFVLGEENVDTDEFDSHVIAHEWGHYFEDKFSRADSLGGSHGEGDLLDPRVAFSEGWGNAFSGIALNDSVYKDSFDTGQSAHFFFDVDDNVKIINRGFWSEDSNQAIIYDLFDSPAEDDDGVGLGFGPIYQTLVSAQKNTTALTTIFPFITDLKNDFPTERMAIDTLVMGQGIDVITDDFGDTETHDAGVVNTLDVIPIYKDLVVDGVVVNVCSTNEFDEPNKLGATQYLRFTPAPGTTGPHTITVALSLDLDQNSDPDFGLYQAGFVTEGIKNSADVSDGGDGSHTEIKVVSLTADRLYVLDVSEFLNADGDNTTGGRNCFDVTVTS